MKNIEESSRNNIFLVDDTANPAPLGLCAFGMTTILLSLHNLGFIGLNSPVVAIAIFYGGIAQVIAGLMEWKKNNSFGFITFGSFGFFWITFAAIVTFPVIGWATKPAAADMAAFLAVWGIFALGLFICTLKMHKLLQLTLFMVVLLIVVLVAENLTGLHEVLLLGGIVGIIAGGLALYMGMGTLINEIFGRRLLPV